MTYALEIPTTTARPQMPWHGVLTAVLTAEQTEAADAVAWDMIELLADVGDEDRDGSGLPDAAEVLSLINEVLAPNEPDNDADLPFAQLGWASLPTFVRFAFAERVAATYADLERDGTVAAVRR